MLRKLLVFLLVIISLGAGTFAYIYVNDPYSLPIEVLTEAAHREAQLRDLKERFFPACTPSSAKPVAVPLPRRLPDFRAEANAAIVLNAIPEKYVSVPAVSPPHYNRHVLWSSGSIRVAEGTPTGSVPMSLVVSEAGDVVEALPLAGLRQHFAEAVAIAKHWKFRPYWRDGQPSFARVEGLNVEITEPPWRRRNAKPLPNIVDWNSLRIKLQQTPGWAGALYSLTVNGNGTVTFDGRGGVTVLGTHCAHISQDSLRLLLKDFRSAGFFSLYPARVQMFDVDRTYLSLEFDDQSASFEVLGDTLQTLADRVLELTAVNRWTHGDELTVPSLQAEGWDFAAQNVTNRNLLDGALQRGTVAAVKQLLALGAPAVNVWQEDRGPPWRPALYEAAQRDDPAFTRLLLESTTRWDQKTLDYALSARADVADLDSMDILIARGAKANAGTLRSAAHSGVPAAVARILKFKPNVNATNDDGDTPLHAAVSKADEQELESAHARRSEVISLLVAAGANVNARDKGGWTPLIANWRGNVEVAKALIAAGVDVNAKGSEGYTALMHTSNAETVDTLLAAGADPLRRNGYGETALVTTIEKGSFAAARALLKRNIAWDKQTLGRALAHAAAHAEENLVAEIIAKRPDVNATGGQKRTPLMSAAQSGNPAVVEQVLRLQPSINAADEVGDTALHYAMLTHLERLRGGEFRTKTARDDGETGRRRIVERLLASGAGLDTRNANGRTALAYCGDPSIVRLLVERGANVSSRDAFGNTPLFGHINIEALQTLIDHGADVNAQSSDGTSPLMRLADGRLGFEKQATAPFEYLLTRGANPHLKDKRGETALDMAKSAGLDELVEILEDWMTKMPKARSTAPRAG